MLRHGLIGCVIVLGTGGFLWNAAGAEEQTPAPAAATPTTKGTDPAPNEVEASIRAALLKRVSLNVAEAPLRDVLKDLAQRHNVPLWIDEATLTDEGITLDSPVTIKVADITLKSVLNLILDPLQSTFVVADEVLKVTTTTRAGETLTTRIYDVEQLLPKGELTSLIELVTSCIASDSWDEVGGPGSVRPIANARALAIRQTHHVHELIATLLDDLQTAKRTVAGDNSIRGAPNPVRDAERVLREKIRTARCSIDAEQAPLNEILASQAAKLGLPLHPDRQTLIDEGIAYDHGVSLHVENIRLVSALNLLLQPLQLTWIIENEVVHITTTTKATEQLVTTVYDVRDLLPEKEKLTWPPAQHGRMGGRFGGTQPGGQGAGLGGMGGGGFGGGGGGGGGFFAVPAKVMKQGFGAAPAANSAGGLAGAYQRSPDPADELIEAITSSVLPDSWSDVGGSGQIRPYLGLLVVRQTQAAHDEIAALLHRLREVAHQHREQAANKLPDDDQQMTLVIYRLDTIPDLRTDDNSAKDLVKLIPESIKPGLWKGAGGAGVIHATGEALVVLQTKAMHEEIVKLLHELLLK